MQVCMHTDHVQKVEVVGAHLGAADGVGRCLMCMSYLESSAESPSAKLS